ncbi:MAG TPA: hypothetical protein VJB59_02170 [Bdellovibrionota bacterium]|nr:hypothetical protein [Bdellovibrionota bacterium]
MRISSQSITIAAAIVASVALGSFLHAGFSETKSRKIALIIGGGGEPPGKETIFDKSFKLLADKVRASGYESHVVFDGGHAKLETIAKTLGTKSDFTDDAIRSTLNQLLDDLKTKKIKPGDQILVVNMSHGIPPVSGQKTHHVSTMFSTFSLDALEELRELAESSHVKIAIVDQSCYSGNTLSLATDRSCVISAAGNHVGTNRDIESFWKEAKPGMSLESIFLNSRRDATPSSSAPRISTPAARETERILNDLTSQFELTPVNLEQNESCADCPANESGEKKFSNVDITAVLDAARVSLFERWNHKLALTQNLRDFENASSERNQLLKRIREFEKRTETIPGTQSPPWSWHDLSKLDITAQTAFYRTLCEKAADDASKQSCENERKSLEGVQRVRASLLRDETFREYLHAREKLESLSKKLEKKADALANTERQLYHRIYLQQHLPEPNPCAGFAL